MDTTSSPRSPDPADISGLPDTDLQRALRAADSETALEKVLRESTSQETDLQRALRRTTAHLLTYAASAVALGVGLAIRQGMRRR